MAPNAAIKPAITPISNPSPFNGGNKPTKSILIITSTVTKKGMYWYFPLLIIFEKMLILQSL